VTPKEYHQPIEDDPRGSFALYRGMAKMYADLAARIHRSNQAAFYRTSSLQGDEPATSGVRSTALVKVERKRDLPEGRTIAAGAMVLEGPQGRLYSNVLETEWIPFDTEPEKQILFRALADGFLFNLGHLADPDGLITAGVYDAADPKNPNANGPDTGAVFQVDLSKQRTAIEGSITAAVGPTDNGRIKDSGKPDRFRATDVGLYARIDSATNPANVGRVLRVIGFEDLKVEDPPLSGLFPRSIIVDDGPQRFKLLSAQADDGGVFTDQTIASNETSPDDMTLLPVVPVAGDAFYWGSATTFSEIVHDLSTLAAATTLTVAIEYFDGASYVAIPGVVDTTIADLIAFAVSGSYVFTPPGDWATDTINSVTAFHVRARVLVAAGVTQNPLGRQAFTKNPNQLVAESGAVTWSILDWADQGFELTEIAAFAGGRDNTLRLLGDERKVFQQAGETDEAFRQRAAKLVEVVSPVAIRNAVNRLLEPFGFRGQAFDVGDDGTEVFFDGFFADVDAADYYDGGGSFPESPYLLPLSEEEAYGFFFIVLPFLGFGDFGIFADEGPVLFVDVPGVYLGGAADSGFVDGFPVDGDAVYRSIFDTVNRIRAGGVGFAMIRDEALNVPPCP
jgi:hypothetical protein